ncbi:unnamed protein product [Prorocentrum cordatum]|uniref:Uncharacterized protein n=1 Tax=Prorocentrum cordatum TaxID=2364126 RepID=A0ABN9T2X9_9DINO|nr:unnamed protein product [Polarella glacialis]
MAGGEAEAQGFLPDGDSPMSNALLQAYVRAGDPEGAAARLERMREDGFELNADSYTAVANGFAQQGDAQRAREWSQRAQDSRPSRDKQSGHRGGNIELNAFAQAGDVAAIESWMDESERLGKDVDVVAYNTAMKAFAQQGDVTRLLGWLERMLAARLAPDSRPQGLRFHFPSCLGCGGARSGGVVLSRPLWGGGVLSPLEVVSEPC